MASAAFWHGRRVLVTGHAGFKGGWLCAWLARLGAEVTGVGLWPGEGAGGPSLFDAAGLGRRVRAYHADIDEPVRLRRLFEIAAPEVVFHLAAQPLVLASVRDPAGTFATNVMGTVNLLEAVRRARSAVRAVVVVTSDKCYRDTGPPAAEDAPLGGADPYSASKACAEIVTAAYRATYLAGAGVGVATARAGNVIGGGDWAEDRLVPDVARAVLAGRPAVLRNPGSVRPWQHVLDALAGYLALAERLAEEPDSFAGGWNFGPDEAGGGGLTVEELARTLVEALGGGTLVHAPAGPAAEASAGHEVLALRLSAERARRRLGWRPLLPIGEAAAWTAEACRRQVRDGDAGWLEEQLARYAGRLGAAPHGEGRLAVA